MAILGAAFGIPQFEDNLHEPAVKHNFKAVAKCCCLILVLLFFSLDCDLTQKPLRNLRMKQLQKLKRQI